MSFLLGLPTILGAMLNFRGVSFQLFFSDLSRAIPCYPPRKLTRPLKNWRSDDEISFWNGPLFGVMLIFVEGYHLFSLTERAKLV